MLNLTPVAKDTFEYMALGHMPYKSDHNRWKQDTGRGYYRYVAQRTLDSLATKKLIHQNGDLWLPTKYAEQFVIRSISRVDWAKLKESK